MAFIKFVLAVLVCQFCVSEWLPLAGSSLPCAQIATIGKQETGAITAFILSRI